jgi:ribosomal protein S18 acetylase RimI-like enzyme
MDQKHIEKICAIHLDALPEDVLPRLGKSFVENFYRIILTERDQLVIGYRVEKKIVGFILLSKQPITIFPKFISFRLFISLLKLSFLRPKTLVSAIVQWFKRTPMTSDVAEISYFAVLPEFQGRGIGMELIKSLNEFVGPEIKFIQTKTSNINLRNYYISRIGAEIVHSFKALDRDFSVLEWRVKNLCLD